MSEGQTGSWRHVRLLVPVIALLLCALLFVTGQRENVFLFFNGIGRLPLPGMTVLWENITLLGDSYIVLLWLLLLVGQRPQVLTAAVMGAVLASVASNTLKNLFQVMRPPAVIPELIQVLGPVHLGNSMPSGHTLSAFLLAALLVPLCRHRWQVAGVLALAVLVGLSRMVCGVHWPTDVTAGAAIGWLCGLAGQRLAARWSFANRPGVQRFFALLLLTNAVWVIGFYHSHHPAAEPFKYLIAVTCCLLALPACRRLFSRTARPDSPSAL